MVFSWVVGAKSRNAAIADLIIAKSSPGIHPEIVDYVKRNQKNTRFPDESVHK
jgi:hypothetical protein